MGMKTRIPAEQNEQGTPSGYSGSKGHRSLFVAHKPSEPLVAEKGFFASLGLCEVELLELGCPPLRARAKIA